MFGLPSFKLIGLGLAALFIGAVVFAGYRYVTNLQQAVTVLTANNGRLQLAVDTQSGVITQLGRSIIDRDARAEAFQRQLEELAEGQQRNRDELDRVNSTFAKHDLEKLADAKPQLVENRINRGTRDAIRLLNDAGRIADHQQAGRGGASATPAAAPPRAAQPN